MLNEPNLLAFAVGFGSLGVVIGLMVGHQMGLGRRAKLKAAVSQANAEVFKAREEGAQHFQASLMAIAAAARSEGRAWQFRRAAIKSLALSEHMLSRFENK
jgi:uncharacterized protein YcfJ